VSAERASVASARAACGRANERRAEGGRATCVWMSDMGTRDSEWRRSGAETDNAAARERGGDSGGR